MRIGILKLVTAEKFNFKDIEKFKGFMGNFFRDDVLHTSQLLEVVGP